jgi:endonuclease-3
LDALGFNLPGLLAQLINFAILLVILRLVAYKPIMRMLDERSRRVREGLEAAERMKEQAAQADVEVEKRLEEARQELLSLPGVGYKTADVLLVFAAERDVLPVDTHIFRISKRLGIAPPKAGYEEVRLRLEEFTPSGRRGEAHMLLIQHGRRYCRARDPLCGQCPVSDLCPIGIRHSKRASRRT